MTGRTKNQQNPYCGKDHRCGKEGRGNHFLWVAAIFRIRAKVGGNGGKTLKKNMSRARGVGAEAWPQGDEPRLGQVVTEKGREGGDRGSLDKDTNSG